MANALTEQRAVSPTRKVPRLDIDGSSDQICHHYLQGKCTYGDSYRFTHAADAPSNVMAASLVAQAAPTPCRCSTASARLCTRRTASREAQKEHQRARERQMERQGALGSTGERQGTRGKFATSTREGSQSLV